MIRIDKPFARIILDRFESAREPLEVRSVAGCLAELSKIDRDRSVILTEAATVSQFTLIYLESGSILAPRMRLPRLRLNLLLSKY